MKELPVTNSKPPVFTMTGIWDGTTVIITLEEVAEGCRIGNRRVDFLVNGKIPVELKAINLLEDVYLAQTVNYLEVGLLIIFGNKKLECKCLVKPKFKQQIK